MTRKESIKKFIDNEQFEEGLEEVYHLLPEYVLIDNNVIYQINPLRYHDDNTSYLIKNNFLYFQVTHLTEDSTPENMERITEKPVKIGKVVMIKEDLDGILNQLKYNTCKDYAIRCLSAWEIYKLIELK